MVWDIIAAGSSILGGILGWKAGNDAADRSLEIGAANADDLMAMTYSNLALQGEAAQWNADMILMIGEANAASVERNYKRNALLMGHEELEGLRRHFIEERQTLGTIRAMEGGTGIQANTGTNLRYMLDVAEEAETQRKYTADRATATILNYSAQEQERADLIRLDSSARASATLYNQEVESMIAMNEATAQAAAYRRGSELNASVARTQSWASLVSGIGGAAGAFG